MSKSTHRVIYKPSSQSTEEYSVFVDEEEYKAWSAADDKSVALARVVGPWSIFFSNQGSQGQLGQASQQQIDTLCGTSEDGEVVKAVKVEDAIEYILKKGTLKAGSAIGKGPTGVNASRGGNSIDTRGSGGSLRG